MEKLKKYGATDHALRRNKEIIEKHYKGRVKSSAVVNTGGNVCISVLKLESDHIVLWQHFEDERIILDSRESRRATAMDIHEFIEHYF